ncbi:MAG: 2-oxoacid:acceptor oxidoreductase subunit alpha [Candidatus Saliniplasma sp.]
MNRMMKAGTHFLDGNTACAEGAIAAGCTFFAGYPITPASEILERIANRFPELHGSYLQMEDELASIAAILGASWAGRKAMTATSGPGFSLMMENYGLGLMTETPCVIVNVMRGGPSTGLPTKVAQGDVNQTRWGTHGDVGVVVYVPSSPQEMFDMTIQAFNTAEKYRLPVVVLSDEMVAHMTEKVEIPERDKIEIVDRKKPRDPPEEFLPYSPDEDLVPPMANAGDGYSVHVTGLTHDEEGHPSVDEKTQNMLVTRLIDKIRKNADDILEYDEYKIEDAKKVIVAYGSVYRAVIEAVDMARKKGYKVGLLRPKTIWPFPEERIYDLAREGVDSFLVAEINFGQIVFEVERCTAGAAQTYLAPKMGGSIHTPEEILERVEAIEEGEIPPFKE